MQTQITLRLSKDQRDLLLKHQDDFFDLDIARIFSLAVKKNNFYEYHLTDAQLEFLHDDLCRIANHTKNRTIQRALDKLWKYLEECMIKLDEEEQDKGKKEYSNG